MSSISYLLSNSLSESSCWNLHAYMTILEIMSARRVNFHHWFLPESNFKWREIPALALWGYNLYVTGWQIAREHYPKIKIFPFSTSFSSPSPSHPWKNHSIMEYLRLGGTSEGHAFYSKQAIFDVWSDFKGPVCPVFHISTNAETTYIEPHYMWGQNWHTINCTIYIWGFSNIKLLYLCHYPLAFGSDVFLPAHLYCSTGSLYDAY